MHGKKKLDSGFFCDFGHRTEGEKGDHFQALKENVSLANANPELGCKNETSYKKILICKGGGVLPS